MGNLYSAPRRTRESLVVAGAIFALTAGSTLMNVGYQLRGCIGYLLCEPTSTIPYAKTQLSRMDMQQLLLPGGFLLETRNQMTESAPLTLDSKAKPDSQEDDLEPLITLEFFQ